MGVAGWARTQDHGSILRWPSRLLSAWKLLEFYYPSPVVHCPAKSTSHSTPQPHRSRTQRHPRTPGRYCTARPSANRLYPLPPAFQRLGTTLMRCKRYCRRQRPQLPAGPCWPLSPPCNEVNKKDEKWCRFIFPLVFVLANDRKMNSQHFSTAFFIFPCLLVPKVRERKREQPLTNSPCHLAVMQARSGLPVWRSGGIRWHGVAQAGVPRHAVHVPFMCCGGMKWHLVARIGRVSVRRCGEVAEWRSQLGRQKVARFPSSMAPAQ
jgi:hypothetical protein